MQKVHNQIKQLTLPQNGGNRVSEDLKFQNFPGEDAPGPPTGAPPSADAFHRTPSPKNLDPRQQPEVRGQSRITRYTHIVWPENPSKAKSTSI